MGNGGGASVKLPEWLPDGWIMKTKRRKEGKVDRYYISPMSRRTFRSKVEVLRYLSIESANPTVAVNTKLSDAPPTQSSPIWLPSGWTVEIKTCRTGANAGRNHKCYFDPLTGCRFSSKAEVFHHLRAQESWKFTSKMKKPSGAKPEENQHCNSTPNQESISAGSRDDAPISAEELNEGSRVRRCLFVGKVQNSGRRAGEEGEELMMGCSATPPHAEAAPHSEKDAGLSCRDPRGHFHGGRLPDLGLEPAEEAAALNQVLKKKLDPAEPPLKNRLESDNQRAVPAGQEPTRVLRRSVRLQVSKGTALEISGRGARGSVRRGEGGPDGKLAQHRRSEQLALLTRRASKRLAGVEPEPTVDIEVGDRSLKRGRPSTRSRSRLFSGVPDLAVDLPKFEDDSPGGRVGSADHAGAGDTAAEFAVTSPFGDRWPDPCIEFAFKTLTGQIPVPETAAIGDYLFERLSPPPAAGVPREVSSLRHSARMGG